MSIRVGIIGCGKIAQVRHIPEYVANPNVELYGFYDINQARTEELAKKYGGKAFASYEELLADETIEAVSVCTANHVHAEITIAALKAGKHVLCEKPMASNAREAAEMIASSQRNGVALMEAMKSTLSPNFRAVRENLHRIGTPRRYFASFCQYSSRYDKFKEGIVLNAFRPGLSNGAMMDIGVYTIYPLVALFGAPQSVSAQGVVLSSGADGQGAVNMQYEGMNATVLYSKIANSHLPAEIEGEDGNILIDRIQTPTDVRFYPRQAPASGQEKRVEGEPIGTADSHNEYYHEIREFIDLILSGRCESEINNHATSLATMQVIDEVRRQLGVRYPADEA